MIQRSRGARRKRRKAAAQAAREQALHSAGWVREKGLPPRRYPSYDRYISHQANKLDKIERQLRRREDGDFASFLARFATCAALRDAHNVLCLGARLGPEVQALRQLGKFAVGIDLNPGSRNALVLEGDFHAIQFSDGSVDAIYANALDHAFDLDRVLAEIHRVLRPGGVLIADILSGFDENFTPCRFEWLYWSDIDVAVWRICVMGFELLEQQDIDPVCSPQWVQTVFRSVIV